MKIKIVFENILEEEVSKVVKLLRNGVYDLIDGSFFEENCEEYDIKQFDSSFTIEIEKD